jgi:hypothetical protein
VRVDWPALLRARGQSVDLLRANTTRTYIAPNGARAALASIAGSPIADDVVLTGSFAAVQIAPIAAPALLALYVRPQGAGPSFDSIAEQLGLLPSDEGSDVVLLRPANGKILEGTRAVDGLQTVNVPQLVVDSLGGTGRMPAEGEALLEWMAANQDAWQYPSLDAYLTAPRA